MTKQILTLQQSSKHDDSTLVIGVFCLAHCIVELIGDGMVTVSDLFRLFVFISVGLNFVIAYLSGGNTIPLKVKYAAIGYALYSQYCVASLFLGKNAIPEVFQDLFLCQYYVMTLWTLVLGFFFQEVYSTTENGRPKVAYYMEKTEKATMHMFGKNAPTDPTEYGALSASSISEVVKSLTPTMAGIYLQLLNGKLVLLKTKPQLGDTLVVITTEFKESDRGLTFSSIATQIVWETGLDVVVFSGENQESGVQELMKEGDRKHVRLHVSSEGVLVAHTRPSKRADKAVEVTHLKVKYLKAMFDWPDSVGLSDLKHVGDLYDFHLAFPYDAWHRSACQDVMACKIGQRLFVKSLQLFLLDNDLVTGDRDEAFAQTREHLCVEVLKEKEE